MDFMLTSSVLMDCVLTSSVLMDCELTGSVLMCFVSASSVCVNGLCVNQ